MSLGNRPPALPWGVTTLTSYRTLDGHVCSQGCLHGASNHGGQRAVLRSGDVSFHEQDDRRLLIQRKQKTVRCGLRLSGKSCCIWQTVPSSLRAREESRPSLYPHGRDTPRLEVLSGQTDGWMDGQMDQYKEISTKVHCNSYRWTMGGFWFHK